MAVDYSVGQLLGCVYVCKHARMYGTLGRGRLDDLSSVGCGRMG